MCFFVAFVILKLVSDAFIHFTTETHSFGLNAAIYAMG